MEERELANPAATDQALELALIIAAREANEPIDSSRPNDELLTQCL